MSGWADRTANPWAQPSRQHAPMWRQGLAKPSLLIHGRHGQMLAAVKLWLPLLFPTGTDDLTQSILNKPVGNCSSSCYLPGAFTPLIAWTTFLWGLEINGLACNSLAPIALSFTEKGSWRLHQALASHLRNNIVALHLLHPVLECIFEVY